MTPLKAIRTKCSDCSAWSVAEVRCCEQNACSLHPYRMGKRPKPPAPLTPLESIRTHCLSCCADQGAEARLGPKANCKLHLHRTGKHPARRGVTRGTSRRTRAQLAKPNPSAEVITQADRSVTTVPLPSEY